MKKTQRFLSVALCLCLVATMLLAMLGTTVTAAADKSGYISIAKRLEQYSLPENEVVRAIIVLDGKPVIERTDDPLSEQALAIEQRLLLDQNKFLAKLGLGKAAYHYTSLFNGVAIDVRAGDLPKIEKMGGVVGVYVANEYDLPAVEIETDEEIKATWASAITNASTAVANGFSGDGVVVAVIDTGINLTHEALQNNPYITAPALKESDIDEIDTLYGGAYYNEKIPFGYDYYDGDNDPTDQNGHGTHVSTIVGGYVGDDMGNVEFTGAAPGAQILAMKVFGATGGTNSSIYFAALEDAYRLGADVVNMSLGSASGFTYDYSLENDVYGNIYKKLDDAGITVFCSAGNETAMTGSGMSPAELIYGANYILSDYADYGVVGTPSTYPYNTSVASADNAVVKMLQISFNGGETFHSFSDSLEETELDFIYNLGLDEYGFVFVPGVGAESDYAGLDVEGKVVAVLRGELSFQEKVDIAAAMGAAGCIVVNNQTGNISMALEGVTIPAIAVNVSAYEELLAMSGSTITFYTAIRDTFYDFGLLMSVFSSWGTTSDLAFKPEITGIGGYVYGGYYDGPDSYVIMSGTSMSSPNVAGTYAALLSYMRTFHDYMEVEMDDRELSDYLEDLILSTSNILFDEYGMPYSPRQQGTGLMDFMGVASPIYVTNPTESLGYDADMTGTFSVTYEVSARPGYPFGDDVLMYYVAPTLVTDYPAEDPNGYPFIYNTLTPNVVSPDYYTYTVTVDYGDEVITDAPVVEIGEGTTATVTIDFEVNPALIEVYSQYFPNGFFIDGFVEFYDYSEIVSDPANATSVCHGSFIFFEGDWTAASVVENLTSMDILYLYAVLADMGYDPQEYLLSLMISNGYAFNVNYSQIMLYNLASELMVDAGGNIFSEDYLYPLEDRVAISTPLTNGDTYFMDALVVFPSLLRNCKDVTMTVYDMVTGQPYEKVVAEYIRKDVLTPQGVYQSMIGFVWDGSYGVDDGQGGVVYEYVPSGTKAMVVISATLDHPDAEEQVIMTVPVTVDYTAPEISYQYDSESKELTLTVSDSEYLSVLYAYTDSVMAVEEAFDPQTAGTSYTYTIDLSECDDDYFYVEVADFATNVATLEIPLNEGDASNVNVNVEFEKTDGVFFTELDNEGAVYTDYSFLVTVQDGYCLTDDFAVLANGEEVEMSYVPGLNAYLCEFTLDTDEDVVVTVEGVMAHDFQPHVIHEASCEHAGLTEYRCSNCDLLEKYVEYEKLEHTAGEFVAVSNPTCATEGYAVKSCTECEAILETKVLEKLEHTEGKFVTVVEATCETNGYATKSCTECKAVLETKTLKKTGHKEGDFVIVKTPTCSTEGYATKSCTKCKEIIEIKALDKVAHTAGEAVVVVEATCGTSGYSTVSCTACNQIITVTTLEKVGEHTWLDAVVVDATCTTAGSSSKTCSVCGHVEVTAGEAALGHTTEGGAAATCTSAAKCGRCNEHFGNTDASKHTSEDVLYVINKDDATKQDVHHACCGAFVKTEDRPVEEKSGCGSVIGSGLAIIAIVSLGGVMLIKKRH